MIAAPSVSLKLTPAVLRTLLKSKLHRARITDANIHYEGSIRIPRDLMEKVDLWDGEKVLVTSITNGNRLETYVIPGPAGSGVCVGSKGLKYGICRRSRSRRNPCTRCMKPSMSFAAAGVHAASASAASRG